MLLDVSALQTCVRHFAGDEYLSHWFRFDAHREASIQAPNLRSSQILDLRIILHESLSTGLTLKMYVRVSRVGPSTQSLVTTDAREGR